MSIKLMEEEKDKFKNRKYVIPAKEEDCTSMNEHLFFYPQIRNYYKQMYLRNSYMKNFIDMEIDAYLLSDLTSCFEDEWCWNVITELQNCIFGFNSVFKEIKECKPILDDLLIDLSEFKSQWTIPLEREKEGKFKGNLIQNTSKFMKLVYQRMEVKNFRERFDKRGKELMSSSHIKDLYYAKN